MLLNLYCFLSTFRADRKGVAALEYALMAALVAVAIVTAVTTLGGRIATTFNTISTSV